MREEPVTPPVYYKQLVIQHGKLDKNEKAEEINDPIDFLHKDEIDRALPGKPLIGAILTYEQAWYERGLALGKLLHSTSLAPGEVTKIAISHFDRATAGHAGQSASQSDSIESGAVAQSGVQEVQQATSRDTQSGKSMQASGSTQANVGGSGGALFWGASASASVSASMGVSMSSSQSEAKMAAYGARNVNQTTVAHSHAHRGRVATQVQEVSEDESQSARARVLANYNHMHALNMLFFEVLQVYDIHAKVIDAERVIFIPSVSPEIDEKFLERYRGVVIEVMAEAGYPKFGHNLDDLIHHSSYLHLDESEKLNQATQELNKSINDNKIDSMPSDTVSRDLGFQWLKTALENEKTDLNKNDNQKKILEIANGANSNSLHGIYRNVTFSSHETNSTRRIDLLRDTYHKAILWSDQFAVDHGKYSSNPHFSQDRFEPDIVRVEKVIKIEESYHRWQQIKNDKDLSDHVHKTLEQIAQNKSRILQRVYAQMSGEHFMRILVNREYDGEPLEQLVDPRPIAVHGHYIAFKFRHADQDGDATFSDSYTQHAKDGVPMAKVALPSGGVFGEAVLGQGVAAEKIDLTRFWKWQDSPIPILPPDIKPTSMESRAKGVNLRAAQLDASSAQLMQPQNIAPIDLSTITERVSANIRDMSGRDTLASSLAAQTQATQEGSIATGQQSLDTLRANQAFATNVLNSDVAKTAVAAMFPEAEGATILGGLMGANQGGSGGGDGIAGLSGIIGGGSGGDNPSGPSGGAVGIGGIVDGLADSLTHHAGDPEPSGHQSPVHHEATAAHANENSNEASSQSDETEKKNDPKT